MRARTPQYRLRALTASVLLLGCLLGAASRASAARSASEADLKGAYLYNFARFTTWPADAFPSAGSPFTFAVYGDPELAASLTRMFADKRLCERPIRIVLARDPSEAGSAQLVYVAAASAASLNGILPAVQEHSVLTVSEIPSFLRQGGMVRIYQVDQNLRFEINVRAARQAHLQVSAGLLQLAQTVVGAKP